MTSVEDRLSRLERELREVRDTLEIYRKTALYGPLVDQGDSEGASALWTADGIYDWGEGMTNASPVAAVGKEQLTATLEAPEHRDIIRDGSAHWLGLPHVLVDGDRATSVCYSCLLIRDAAGFKVARASVCRFEWIRLAGDWKIRRRRNRVLDGSAAAMALLRESVGSHSEAPPAGRDAPLE